jgi:16S rRNA (uracil1498-N3)-methyltransferase
LPVFFISSQQVSAGRVTISSPLLDHLRSSLRVRPGEELWLGDEHRRRYRITVSAVSSRSLTGEVIEERTGPPPGAGGIALAAAVLKGDRMDWLIQKAVELGVSSIRPVLSERVIVKPKTGRHHQERWDRIAMEAAQQSERWDVPPIEPIVDLQDLLARHEDTGRLWLAERQAAPKLSELTVVENQPVRLLVGPEGGWSEQECRDISGAGWTAVSLGDRILRAETAAIAAMAILQARAGAL